MTDPLTADDAAATTIPYDVRLALGATGLLRVFNQAGVLTAADVHVATRLASCRRADETVLLAVALAVRGVRSGSVCIDLAQAQQADPGPALAAAGLGGRGAGQPAGRAGRPLRWDMDLLYLDRYRRQEEQVRADLLAREAQPPPAVDGPVGRRPSTGCSPRMRPPSAAAAHGRDPVDDGARRRPGTGKTTTVARMLALLLDQPGPAAAGGAGRADRQGGGPAAGGGAAAGRGIRHAGPGPAADRPRRRCTGCSAGCPGGGTRFRHDRDNRLPFDVVVVDETSMVSLTMMARLLEALRPDARLILVGDPDQLASVEAGAVLADLVAGLTGRDATVAASDAGRRTGRLLCCWTASGGSAAASPSWRPRSGTVTPTARRGADRGRR